MTTRSKPALLLCVAIAVSAVAAPPSPADAPVEARSTYSALSPADRLGVKFSPPAKDGERTVAAPRRASVIFLEAPSPDTVILAPYLVTEPRVKLTEKETLTDKGRLELAEKQQLTPLYRKTFGPLSQLAAYYFNWPSILAGWHPNEVEAMALYREEERLKMLSEMDSLIRLETILEPKDTKQFQRIRFGAQVLSR